MRRPGLALRSLLVASLIAALGASAAAFGRDDAPGATLEDFLTAGLAGSVAIDQGAFVYLVGPRGQFPHGRSAAELAAQIRRHLGTAEAG